MKNVLVLVLSTDAKRYPEMIQSIRSTWGSQQNERFKVLYYYGIRSGHSRPAPGQVLRVEDTLICGTGDSSWDILSKTLIAFEYVLYHFAFDYLFRSCAGSYVVRDEMLSFLEDKPIEEFYCGRVGNRPTHPFASGSGYFLSRDLVKRVLDGRNKIDSYRYGGMHDDVAVGRLLFELGVPIDPRALRVDDSDRLEPGHYHYHFRVRPEYMYRLHEQASAPPTPGAPSLPPAPAPPSPAS